MLQLFDKNKRKIAGLIEYENLCIESILESGDKTLSFSYSTFSKFHDEIEEETYIRTKNDEYVVKAKLANSKDNKTAFTCKLNIEELEGNIFDRFETVEKNIIDCLNQAIVSTGWTINTENCTNKKKRTIRITNCSSWTIIQKAKKLYGIEFKFDTLNKVIMLYDRIGTDKGTYFIDSLNLRALQTQGNSYGFYTRIIPTGKNGLTIASVNGGKIYLENKQYSNKTLTYYWKDERYVKPDSLKEDALEKLNIMSKPFKSYIASTINLVEMNEKYKSILYYNLGDYIYLISKKNNIKDKHRIVKTKEYPQDHSKDTVELANKALDLSEEKLLVDEMNTTLDNVTTDNGTLNGSAIDSIQVKQIEDFRANVIEVVNLKAINASIENLHANKADIQDLNAVKARIGTLEATKANITQLTAVSAEVQQLNAIKANITDLNAATAKIGILEAKTASIDNLLAGNLTADNFKANSITAGSGIIASGAIGSAQISSLSVNKLEAGDITTSKHKIVSADGTIEIVGNQILINRNNVNRVILGEYRKSDGTTEYGLLVRAKDGQTIMLDGNGVHNAGITDGAIDNNKVADNANISGNKLDINSVIREVNNNGTETIKGTKVTVGDRTLDVELSTQKNTITEHGKELSSQKATIQALDNAIKLKVDTQTFTQSTTIINNNINRAKEEAINSANSHADNKANEALNNAKAFVNAEITTVNSHLNKATSEINVLKEKIESKVSQSDIDKSIQNIKFNDVNMILNSGEFKDTDHWSCTNGSNNLTIENRILKFKFTNYASWGCYISNNSLLNKPLDISKKYTVVCKLKASKNQILTFNICDGNSYNYVFGKELSLTTEWQIFKFTFNPTQVGNERQFRFITSNLGYDFDLYIEFVKMVEGATSSDSWSMAPDYVLDNIKTVTDKISTVESKLTQENNSIKASVQDLNSTTQTITTNINNINRDLTSKISSNLDVAKSFATDIATNKANTAKQEAINSSNSHADSIAASKATEALNNAKTYINAEISTVNTKVNNVESNLNILSDRINSKVSQSDIDKAVTTIRTEKIIYARGTGNDFPSNALVKVNGKTITDGQGRGLRINALNKVTLERVFLQDYDTFGSEDAKVSFVNKINELNNGDYIIIITSQDASYPLHPPIKEALEKIGATLFDNKQGTYREAYALIGKSKLGRGNGVEMFIPRTANDKRFAEVSVKVGEDGTFIGVNPNNMGLEATLITSNISDVSSELTQTKNSIEASINSINSKTQSIETNLNGKATKQEVNNRVATIKANLDSITQRVSNTESKTNSLETNINGKASKQELTVVNNKVTEVTASLNGITQRVGNTESRINALDGKVAGAVTLQQFTEFKQSNDKFKFTVEQRSSVSNILPNSSFFGGDRGWLHDGVEFWYGSYSGYGFKGRMTGAIKNRTSYNTPERFLQTHKAYKVKKNTTYTISFHYACEMNIHSMEAYVVLSDTEHGDYAQPIRILEKPGGTQSDPNNDIPFTYKFNTGNHEWVWLRFDHNGMKPGTNWDQYCWLYVSEIGIYEGDVGAVKWTPKGGEVYSANYQMDGLGFKGTFEDGTYAQLGRDGFEWYNAGTGHAYHALTYVTSFDVPIGNPGKAYIKLPAEFTKRRSSLKWTVALRGYYYNTTGNFFPFHVHCTGARDYIENGLVVCEVQGLCKIQNGSNSGDVQFRPLTAMLIAIA
ncbi:TPA: phage tail spike protein [Clostridium perfringens]|uniref:phage tail spike protein n=1 Tax=Clostridium perfringens TaxID=1502 RepID=UPI0018AA5D87|nr:phage tail spike protein [Clostridium perfringens]EHR1328793.1 phage tail protein [Clostridium perfringens]EHR1331926.1 phage tail protein [Clostridium perfringens]EHR1425403.1 phage tail protein [Clostridium perfringens]EIF6165320.1 phage tail protein [Clostridium perfringens]MBI5985915.1 phage tail protein [Clostridium perfringens]